jgi:nucleotide-binding universal stress UspA family protein
MNTIIIPVDFSSASENAMHYGARLAQHIGASVLLTHIYQMPVGINDMQVMMLPADELKDIADTGLNRCRVELQKAYADLEIKTESRLGVVYDGVNDLCEELDPFAVVIGSSGTSGFERMLFGSTAISVIRHATHPVIAVPAGYTGFSVKNIVLAADLQEEHPLPYNRINEIVQQFNAGLHLVHVTKEQEPNVGAILEKFSDLKPQYHAVKNENVKEGLLNYVSESNADLLMILPHEHNIMERLFFKLHTEDIITSTRIPVLAIRC